MMLTFANIQKECASKVDGGVISSYGNLVINKVLDKPEFDDDTRGKLE